MLFFRFSWFVLDVQDSQRAGRLSAGKIILLHFSSPQLTHQSILYFMTDSIKALVKSCLCFKELAATFDWH